MGERLKNKVAIITGAAAGIGAATAKLFADEGALVLLADRNAAGAEAMARWTADILGNRAGSNAVQQNQPSSNITG